MNRSASVALATASLALGLLPVGTTPAAASTTRYATPTGSGVACTQVSPCSLPQAVSGASDGDIVQLTAEEYYLTSQLDIVADDLTIQGPAGVTNSASFLAYLIFPEEPAGVPNNEAKIRLFGDRTRFERLAITGRADGSALVGAGTGTEARYERVRIRNSGSSDTLVGDNVTLRNSVIEQTGAGNLGSAVSITGLISSSTIYSATGTAILQANQYHADPNCSTVILNTIAWGGDANMLMDDTSVGPICTSLIVDYDHSWIPEAPGASSSGGIRIAPGSSLPIRGVNNLPDSAALFDPTSPGSTYLSDLVLPVGSPAINAGCSFGSCSSQDYYGRPRPIGSANDIGAMEQSLAPVAGTATAGDVTRTTGTLSAPLQPRGDSTNFRFEVRPTGSPSWTAVATGSQSTDLFGATTVTGSLTDLSPGTTYQARLVATNVRGESASDPVEFQTLAPAPTPDPGPTVSVTSTQASVGRKRARVTSSVTVSSAGRISQRAVRAGRPAKTRCTTSRRVNAAGAYRLTCTLSQKSRKELRKRSLRLVVTTTLTTPTGETATATKRVTVPRRR